MTISEAIQAGDEQAVTALIAGDPNAAQERTAEGVSCVCLAMYHGKRDIAKLLAKTREDLDIHEACSVGVERRVRELIAADPAMVNTYAPDGFTPIALAAYFGHPAIVQLLAESGAEVNAQARNATKVAAIHAAVAARSTECVDILLRHGADPNLTQQQGFTPLQAAEQNRDEAIIQMLRTHGAT